MLKCWALSGSILFDNLLVFLKDIFVGNNDLERRKKLFKVQAILLLESFFTQAISMHRL